MQLHTLEAVLFIALSLYKPDSFNLNLRIHSISQAVSQLQVVIANSALRLKAILDFEESDKTRRVAGDEWLFEGPG